MSFGFGIGDFLAAYQVAGKIRKEFADAPAQYKSISNEVKSLWIAISDIDVEASTYEIDGPQRAKLEKIALECRNVLTDLEKKLQDNVEVENGQRTLGRQAKRVWKRFRWDSEDIRELRERITSNTTLLNTFLSRHTAQMVSATQKGVGQLTQKQDDQDRLDILKWLTPIDYADEQDNFIKRRQSGTGQWLLGSEEFRTWLKTGGQILFCPGDPGVGKTILSSVVVDYLHCEFRNGYIHDDSSTGIAYLYCKYNRKAEQQAEDLLLSMLKQLSRDRRSLPDCVKTLHDICKPRQRRPSLDEISAALHIVASLYSRVFIIIDALDECEAGSCRTRLLKDIFDLTARSGANVFTTSRFIPEITEKFGGSLYRKIHASKEDVGMYLDGQMRELSSFDDWSPKLQAEIKSAISDAVDGMFLLARIYLGFLEDKTNPAAVRKALMQFMRQSPGSGESKKVQVLNHAYGETMKRIEQQKPGFSDLAKKTLAWITCAKRQLTTVELQHALAVEVGDTELDADKIDRIERIVSVCAGLVTVNEESDIIQLVHYTTQEYLEQTSKTWFPNAQCDITTACVTYLSFSAFETGRCRSDKEFEARLKSSRLYDYAACCWGHHARQASSLHSTVHEFLQCRIKVEAAAQAMLALNRQFRYVNYSQFGPSQVTGLHLAAYLGLEQSVAVLLKRVEVDSKDSRGRTPLLWAAENGQETIISMLVSTGKADVNAKGERGETPLSCAAENGHEAVVRLLVNTGKADIDSKDVYGETPLLDAAKYGHEAVVRLLVDTGKVDIDSKNSYGQTPLLCAAKNGHETVVRLLVDTGKVDIDSKDSYGQTPLSCAAKNGHEAVVRLLVDTGKVDVDSKDRDRRTPL